MLEAKEGLEVVDVARDGETVIKMAAQYKPDAVVMDIELEGEIDGIEAALRIKEDMPHVGIVILSSHRDRRYLTSLLSNAATAGRTCSSSRCRTSTL